MLLERPGEAALHEAVDERAPIGGSPRRHVPTLAAVGPAVTRHPPPVYVENAGEPGRVVGGRPGSTGVGVGDSCIFDMGARRMPDADAGCGGRLRRGPRPG